MAGKCPVCRVEVENTVCDAAVGVLHGTDRCVDSRVSRLNWWRADRVNR